MSQYTNSENGQTETQVVDAANSPFSLPSGQPICKVVVEGAASASWKGESTQGAKADYRSGSANSYATLGAELATLPGVVVYGNFSAVNVTAGQIRVFGSIL